MASIEIPSYSFNQLRGLENLVKTFRWEEDIQGYNFEEPHSHTYHEIMVFVKGGGSHVMGDLEFTNNDYSFHILPSGFAHQNKRSKDSDGFTLVFSSHYLDQLQLFNLEVAFSNLISEPRVIALSRLEFEGMKIYLDEVQKEGLTTAERLNLFAIIIIRLVSKIPEEEDREKRPLFSYQLLQLLNVQFRYKRDTAFYAGSFHMSVSSFSKKVKSVFGKSILDIQNEKILSESKQMLLQNKWTVQEIAHAFHFSDESHFCRVFKKAEGLTPKEYISTHLSKDKTTM